MSKFGAENSTTEFKVQLSDSLEKEVVAFLNSAKGGDLYIGVDDGGEVVGTGEADALALISEVAGAEPESEAQVTPEVIPEVSRMLNVLKGENVTCNLDKLFAESAGLEQEIREKLAGLVVNG